MSELVNAKYFIEKTGLHQSWARKILQDRLEPQGEHRHPKMYIKKDVDVIIKELKTSSKLKSHDEWDIKDMQKYFGLSRSYIQLLVNCEKFPKHARKTAVTGGRYARLWKSEVIKNLDMHKLEYGKRQKRTFIKAKETGLRLTTIEQQFLRGFRL
ncbi:MAG: hypothetical protein PHR19_02520 [Bacteroidales bacterium]|nr:hypothetical protein [Bacteroidales bacterium]